MYPDSAEGEFCPGKVQRTSPAGNDAGALPPHPRSFTLWGHLEGVVSLEVLANNEIHWP